MTEVEPDKAFGPYGDFSFERELQFERYLAALPNNSKKAQ